MDLRLEGREPLLLLIGYPLTIMLAFVGAILAVAKILGIPGRDGQKRIEHQAPAEVVIPVRVDLKTPDTAVMSASVDVGIKTHQISAEPIELVVQGPTGPVNVPLSVYSGPNPVLVPLRLVPEEALCPAEVPDVPEQADPEPPTGSKYGDPLPPPKRVKSD